MLSLQKAFFLSVSWQGCNNHDRYMKIRISFTLPGTNLDSLDQVTVDLGNKLENEVQQGLHAI